MEGLDYCSSREDRSDDPNDLKGYQQEEEYINNEDFQNEYNQEPLEASEENSEMSYETWKAQQQYFLNEGENP